MNSNNITNDKVEKAPGQECSELVELLNKTAHDLFAQTNISQGVHQMLSRLLIYFNADRAYIFENHYETKTSENTYEVCADGIQSEIDNLRAVPFSAVQFWFNLFSRQEYICIEDVNQLDDSRQQERSILQTQKIQSLIAVPLMRNSFLIGFLGVDNPRVNHNQVNRLTALGDYLCLGLMNRDNLTKLQKEHDMYSSIMNKIEGGLGVFHYYYDGQLKSVFINDGYYDMMNVKRHDRKMYNDFAVINAVYGEDKALVYRALQHCMETDEKIDIDIRIVTHQKDYKWFNIKANLISREKDYCVLYALYSDIDKLKTMQLQLKAREEAMALVTTKAKVQFWIYDIDEHVAHLLLDEELPLEAKESITSIPDSLIQSGHIHEKDIEAVKTMFHELDENAVRSECCVRVVSSKESGYEWRRMIYTRIHDERYKNRTAIGFSLNADLEMENRQRYEHEMQLRTEMMKNAISYYQLNLTKNRVEEYFSPYEVWQGVDKGTPIDTNLQKRILDVVYPDDREKIENTLFSIALKEAYMEGKSSVSVRYRVFLPEFGVCWAEGTATIMERFNSGDLIALVFNQDIDIKMKDELAIGAIMDEEIESVAVVNVDNGIAHFAQINTSYTDYKEDENFDYTSSYMKIIKNYVVPEEQEICDDFFNLSKLVHHLKDTPVVKLVFQVMEKDGGISRKKTRAFYLDETKREIILIRRDITDLYQEEQRQKKELQQAVEAANQANNSKSEFLSRMSHDMRTPLNAILSFSSDEVMGHANEEQYKKYLQKIHFSGEYLLGIINDVLDMSKIEQNKLVLKPVPYSSDEFIEIVNDIIKEPCKAKNIQFFMDFNLTQTEWIIVDKVRFNQIFINLLSNAVKFTNTGGKIEFLSHTISTTPDGIEWREFTVRDNGIGMSPEFLPHAFDSFSQENTSHVKENNQGTGLGLSIVKRLVSLMGGTIRVESTKGVGTCFTVELPMTGETVPPKAGQTGATDIDLHNRHILLCEDNAINVEIALLLLESQGCIVDCAEDGIIGLEKFCKSEPGYYSAILMDIRMPNMDGYTATKELRSLNRSDAKTVPIIALTADVFTTDAKASVNVGMNAHLQKPIVPKQLFLTLRSQIQQAQNKTKNSPSSR